MKVVDDERRVVERRFRNQRHPAPAAPLEHSQARDVPAGIPEAWLPAEAQDARRADL